MLCFCYSVYCLYLQQMQPEEMSDQQAEQEDHGEGGDFQYLIGFLIHISVSPFIFSAFVSMFVFDLQQRREISFIRRVSCRAHIRGSHHWLYFLNKVPHINVLPSRQVNVPHLHFHNKMLSKPTTKRDEGVERVGQVSTLSIHTV